MLKLEVAAKPLKLFVRPGFDFDEGVSAGQHAIDRHHKHFDQIVSRLAGLARIGDGDKHIR